MKKFTAYIAMLFVVLLGGYVFYQKLTNPVTQQNPIINSNEQSQTGQPQSQTQSNSQIAPSGQPNHTSLYKDGTYIGAVADSFYGPVQVSVSISGGRINNIQFLQYPNDRGHTIEVSNYALPILKSEAIASQSVNVDGVSGATQTYEGFMQTLSSALAKAKNS